MPDERQGPSLPCIPRHQLTLTIPYTSRAGRISVLLSPTLPRAHARLPLLHRRHPPSPLDHVPSRHPRLPAPLPTRAAPAAQEPRPVRCPYISHLLISQHLPLKQVQVGTARRFARDGRRGARAGRARGRPRRALPGPAHRRYLRASQRAYRAGGAQRLQSAHGRPRRAARRARTLRQPQTQ